MRRQNLRHEALLHAQDEAQYGNAVDVDSTAKALEIDQIVARDVLQELVDEGQLRQVGHTWELKP